MNTYIINGIITLALSITILLVKTDTKVLNIILMSAVLLPVSMAFTYILEGPISHSAEPSTSDTNKQTLKSGIVALVIFGCLFGAVFWLNLKN